MSAIRDKLLTNDGKVYTVNRALLQQMGTIRNMLMLEFSESDSKEVIPLPNVDSKTLRLLLKWCKSLRFSPNDVETEVGVDILKKLIRKASGGGGDSDQDDVLFRVIEAANYLQLETLLQAGTQLLADIIHSCDHVEALRLRFNIKNEEE